MKLYIKIKGVNYKLVKADLKHAPSNACDLCDASGNFELCKKLNKYCKGKNHYFIVKFKKEKSKS